MDEQKELKACQLDLLMELKRVCEKFDICFFLVYGTCIGAIRHNGFIPWDDDIDIGMTIKDFEKLKKHADEFGSKYFLQTNTTDPEYGLMIGRLRNSETTLIESTEAWRDINHGAFIDIYPMYDCPQGGIKFKFMEICSLAYRLLLYNDFPKNKGNIVMLISKVILKIIPNVLKDKICRLLFLVIMAGEGDGYLCSFYGNKSDRKVFKKEEIIPPKYVTFEGKSMPVPCNYDAYLTGIYGNYMELPPEDQRTIHHQFEFIDLQNGFEKYRGIKFKVGK